MIHRKYNYLLKSGRYRTFWALNAADFLFKVKLRFAGLFVKVAQVI